MPSLGRLLHLLFVALALPSCASAPLPPPDVASAPAPVAPRLEHPLAPPAGGVGIVVFDSVSGPATVTRVLGRSTLSGYSMGARSYYRGQSISTALVCEPTPCVGYLPFGDHEVILESTENNRRAEYVVKSSEVPRALRASLDLRIRADPKRTLGLVTAVTGLVGVGLGALLLTANDQSGGLQRDGAVLIGVGGLAVAIGGLLFATGHPSARYDGQGTVWDLKPEAPPPPAVPTGATQL